MSNIIKFPQKNDFVQSPVFSIGLYSTQISALTFIEEYLGSIGKRDFLLSASLDNALNLGRTIFKYDYFINCKCGNINNALYSPISKDISNYLLANQHDLESIVQTAAEQYINDFYKFQIGYVGPVFFPTLEETALQARVNENRDIYPVIEKLKDDRIIRFQEIIPEDETWRVSIGKDTFSKPYFNS